MLRLVKYLKPFIPMILLAVILLFVQANADLALPDYMADIVNYGIQQGGVKDAVPQALRQSEMSRVMLLLSPDERNQVQRDYTLVDRTAPDYGRYLKEYPELANQPVYVLNNLSPAEIDLLSPVVDKALMAVYSIEQVQTDPAKASALGADAAIDLSALPAGTDPFALIAKLPADPLAKMTAALNARFSGTSTANIVRAAAPAIKAEYAALGMDTARLQTDSILATGRLMLLLSLLSGACTIGVGFLAARVSAGLGRNLRRLVFAKVENFSNAEFDKFSTASLITRSTNDITQIQMVVMIMVRMVIYAPIMGVGGVMRAMGKSTSMWWLIALAVLVLIGVVATVFSISLPKFRIVQTLIDRLNRVTRENLAGMMVIRAFNRQGFEEARFDEANRDLTRTNLFVNRVMVVMMPAMMVIMNGLTLLIIWIGAQQVAQSAMQVGDMMAFMQYAIQIVASFLMLSMMFIFLPRASVSGDRIAAVLETEPTILDPQNPQTLETHSAGKIEFQNVSFRYPGAEEDVLHDITFTAQPGQTTAIIGATGAGKTTLINLIPRFYDVTGGSICVDGRDVRAVTQHDLRERIGYVPQKSNLFSGTIESNLRYAAETASPERLASAVEIAQAGEFIWSKPEGLRGEISQGGMNVSGGQKQRLSIARALVKEAPINILDDSFSALDFKTDAALRRALKQRTAARTVLIVTQRVATIKDAEQILVLEQGRMVGQGTHRELMETCATYREIASSQLSQEELA